MDGVHFFQSKIHLMGPTHPSELPFRRADSPGWLVGVIL